MHQLMQQHGAVEQVGLVLAEAWPEAEVSTAMRAGRTGAFSKGVPLKMCGPK